MWVLTHGQFRLLVDAMAPRYRLFIRFLIGTCLYWSEATALHVADFDFVGQRDC